MTQPAMTSASDLTVPRLLLTPREVAVALGVSRSKVYELMNRGAFPSVNLDRSRRIRISDLERFVATLGTREDPE